ncbi:MAG: hypothetical protein KME32_11265 [Mojavia pulchra JT2-VF2]|uniref:Uncharacterized protein n=1 Tax=Mojavia pulchra JT2-VF2 TaxID=287848 RepID=A0A951PY81_9NOST|nr:hypothetical protein [Mojavia pulchra JT2-VF2]
MHLVSAAIAFSTLYLVEKCIDAASACRQQSMCEAHLQDGTKLGSD